METYKITNNLDRLSVELHYYIADIIERDRKYHELIHYSTKLFIQELTATAIGYRVIT